MVNEAEEQPPLSLQELLEQEFSILHGSNPARNANLEADPLAGICSQIAAQRHTALCISGGGIRSASFGLGVLQALAQHGLLAKLDYLSTVSGGGYIGSWLSAWIHRHPNGRDGVISELSNFRRTKIDPEAEPIRRLREYSHYLTPQWGLLSADTWTWMAIFLRNLILNWLVLIPLLASVLAIPRLCVEFLLLNPDQSFWTKPFSAWSWPFGPFSTVLLIGGFAFAVIGIDYVNQNLPSAGTNKDQGSFLRACLLPLLCAAVALTTSWAWFRNSVGSSGASPGPGAFMIFGATLHLAGCSAYVFRASRASSRRHLYEILSPAGILALAAIIFAGAFGGLIVRLAATADVFSVPKEFAAYYVTLAAPLLLTLFSLATAIYIGLASYVTSDADREWWARAGGWILIAVVGWVTVSGLVLFGPAALLNIEGLTAKAFWSLGGISGLITLVLGKNSSTPANKKEGEEGGWWGSIQNLILTVAAPLFAAFIIVVISFGSGWLFDAVTGALSSFLQNADFRSAPAGFWSQLTLGRGLAAALLLQFPLLLISLVIGALLLIGITMGFFINANKFSLHGAYRDRLIRAYLGASHENRSPNLFTGFDPADNMPMSALRVGCTGRFERPFHVINMTLNLVKGGNLAWQERKAESFTASPLHSGSYRVGYRYSDQYGGTAGLDGGEGMSLGTAVAISGAAASPNWGYHSSPVVTFLMALFNVRLGWWLGNPGPAGARTFRNRGPAFSVRPLIDETLGLTTDTNEYVYLSDGGHFENLGLYEMVLRRCRVIIVSDAGADPKCELEDFGNAIRKIRVDLGVPVEIRENFQIYRRQSTRGKRWATATIRYSAVDPGTEDGILVYMKPAFYGDEPIDIVNYGTANQQFPHESTLDQWFSESQFESYRLLGSYTAEETLQELRAKNWEGTPLEKWLASETERRESC